MSANDEWIELYNDGAEAVVLDGWVLSGEDGTPTITLTGSIDSGGYFLLERSDDSSVPDVTADLIFTGALGNDIENLILTDGGGLKIDEVQSGEGWSLGGNNITKHTAQRQGDGTWITGVPTPRTANSTENTKATESTGGEVAGTGTSKTTTTKKTGGYKQTVFAYAGMDMESVAGALAFFKAYGVNDTNELRTDVRYRWTFGDGGTAKERMSRHIYRFPGTYTAVLTVSNDEQDSRDTVIVRVVSADIEIKDVLYGEDGYIELYNKSASTLDLSLWEIRVKHADGKQKQKTFTIPMTTVIAPHASVPFPSVITRIASRDGSVVELVLPSGRVISSYGPVTVVPDTGEEQ